MTRRRAKRVIIQDYDIKALQYKCRDKRVTRHDDGIKESQ